MAEEKSLDELPLQRTHRIYEMLEKEFAPKVEGELPEGFMLFYWDLEDQSGRISYLSNVKDRRVTIAMLKEFMARQKPARGRGKPR